MFKKDFRSGNLNKKQLFNKNDHKNGKLWVRILKNWVLIPTFILLLLPVKILLDSRKNNRFFLLASFILKDSGSISKKSFVSQREKKLIKRFGKLPLIFKVYYFLKSVFWMPRTAPFDAELSLNRRLFAATSISYIFFIIFLCSSLSYAYDNSFVELFSDLYGIVFNDGEIFYYLLSGQSAIRDLIMAVIFWSFSLINGIILYTRPYKKKSKNILSFLGSLRLINFEELEEKTKVIALNDMIFISSPSISASKLKDYPHGWPDGFLPGEIVENIKNPSELVIIRREERDPIIFGGDYASRSIIEHLQAYDDKIVNFMRDEREVRKKPELLFLGEVIDSAWWKSSQIFIPLNTNPHVTITGQTRSGKTKGLLSLIYSFAKSYPDTTWFFADGKSSSDYDPFANRLSAFPVAKPDENGDPLIQFANILDSVWGIYNLRKNMFAKAQMDGKSCSTIYEYRNKVGPLEHVFFVIDEFAVFVGFMDFDNNWKKEDTLANRIKRLLAESASYGIHLIIATQRYQNTDLPPVIRTNLTARLIYNVNQADADYLKIENASKLKSGQSYAQANGLYCEHTGLNTVKVKLPYIGDSTDELLEKTIKQFPIDKKRQFDKFLLYTKGDDDIENMSISGFCMRLYKFFRDQNYISKFKEQDLESTDLQMEIKKARRFKKKSKKNDDNSSSSTYGEDLLNEREELDIINSLKSKFKDLDFSEYDEVDGEILVAKKNSPAIGISVLRSDEIDEDALIGIQNRYSKQYKFVIIFAVGKNLQSNKSKFVDDLNERGNIRFIIYQLKDYRKDFRFVESKRKSTDKASKVDFDIISEKISKLGNSSIENNTGDSNIISWSDIHDKTPIKTKLQKVFEVHGLKIVDSDLTRKVPYVKTILPGGVEFLIFIVMDKDKKEDVKITAIEESEKGLAVAIIIDAVFSSNEKKIMKEHSIISWRFSEIDEWVNKCRKNSKIDDFVIRLLKESGVIEEDGNRVRFGNNPVVTIRCEGDVHNNIIPMVKIFCELTGGFNVVNFSDMPLESYRLDYLGLPSNTTINLTQGIAPLNSDPKKVKIKNKTKLYNIKLKNLESKNGILFRRNYKIDENDPFLNDMMDE